jgi:hypothetical protein
MNILRFSDFLNENMHDEEMEFTPRQQEYLNSYANDRHSEYNELKGELGREQGVRPKAAIIWNPETAEIEIIFMADPTRDQHGFEDEKESNPDVEIYFVEFDETASIRTVGGELDLEDVKVLGKL